MEFAYENGIQTFDTAYFYGDGKAEALLAKTFSKYDRSTIRYMSKAGLEWKGNTVYHDTSYKNILHACERSLNTLKTNYIDLFQLHWPDSQTPLSESIEAFQELKKKGFIKEWGVCNCTEKEIKELPLDVYAHQLHYNPLHTQTRPLLSIFKDQVPKGLNCIYSPFEQGLLINKYPEKPTTVLTKRDVRHRNPYFTNPETHKKISEFFDTFKNDNKTQLQTVLTWLISHAEIDHIIVGARTLKQMKEIIDFKNLSNQIFLLQ